MYYVKIHSEKKEILVTNEKITSSDYFTKDFPEAVQVARNYRAGYEVFNQKFAIKIIMK